MGERSAGAILHWLQLGMIARRHLRLRLMLLRMDAERRLRRAGLGAGLMAVAGMLAFVTLGLGLAAVVVLLAQSGFGWPGALALTAGGSGMAALLLALAGRAALRAALRGAHDRNG